MTRHQSLVQQPAQPPAQDAVRHASPTPRGRVHSGESNQSRSSDRRIYHFGAWRPPTLPLPPLSLFPVSSRSNYIFFYWNFYSQLHSMARSSITVLLFLKCARYKTEKNKKIRAHVHINCCTLHLAVCVFRHVWFRLEAWPVISSEFYLLQLWF